MAVTTMHADDPITSPGRDVHGDYHVHQDVVPCSPRLPQPKRMRWFPCRQAHRFFRRREWDAWLFLFVMIMTYCFAYRCVTVRILTALYADKPETGGKEATTPVGPFVLGLFIGVLEDAVLLLYIGFLLCLFDSILYFPSRRNKSNENEGNRVLYHGVPAIMGNQATWKTRLSAVSIAFIRVVLLLATFAYCIVPFAADVIMLRARTMRFTFEFVEMSIREKETAKAVEITEEEWAIAYEVIGISAALLVVLTVVSFVWLDFSLWNPTDVVKNVIAKRNKTITESEEREELPSTDSDGRLSGEKSCNSGDLQYASMEEGGKKHQPSLAERPTTEDRSARWIAPLRCLMMIFCLVLYPWMILGITHAMSFFSTSVALNTSVNEPFGVFTGKEFLATVKSGDANFPASLYLDPSTEDYTLFAEDVLYRRTNGFKGPLAFKVDVDPKDPPNVLVLVVESFRYHDSKYLVGNNTYFVNHEGSNVSSLTPNFDRWAKRGVAFRNMWSSWQTSRSLESILFGQIPYDDPIRTGTSGGRVDVELSGMPQFFKARGYESIFTTGCRVDYDSWDPFLPKHGFETVLSDQDFRKMAEAELNISSSDWSVKTKARAMEAWGVHDDVALSLLGNIMINKTEAQRNATKKKPFFINHYTISSHTPFTDRPAWYEDYKDMPDFRPYCADGKHKSDIRRYAEMRYFTDLALGKFMDRMEKEGVLNNTIVVIVGDHGQAPEAGLPVAYERAISVTRVAAAIIAEGRLAQEDVGKMVHEVAEQYDFLNTLMDMVGVPEGGFLQTGVGRSLLRQMNKTAASDRVVFSNNPLRKMAVVRGKYRTEYARVTSGAAMYNTELDHDETKDVYATMVDTPEKRKEMDALLNAGRHLSSYFKHRWDRRCLLQVEC